MLVSQVEARFENVARIWHLHLASGQVIRTTAEHPFWGRGRGWVAARQLRVGDELRSHDGQWLAVEDVRDTGREEVVYNCRVAEYHTYFVGCDEWGFSLWAHNAYNPQSNPATRQVGEQFRERAQELWRTLPRPNRYGATVAVTQINGVKVMSLYANIGRGRGQFTQAQINRFQRRVESAGGVFIHTSGKIHAEQALHQAYGNAPAIGISNYYGPCSACSRYFQQQGYFNLFWPDLPLRR